MTERKRKRNTRTFNAGEGFHISRQPVVRVAADDRQRNVDGAAQLPLAYGPPLLCAIARDSHCIFAVWNIDWLSLFEKGMPVDRQIHLRVYRADGLQEKTVAVEPMSGTHCVTTSELHGAYHLEIGYYQPADVWHSVAISKEIVMPSDTNAKTEDVDLVTIPFHLSFQHLLDSLGAPNNTALATIISRFQKRILSSEERQRLSPQDKRILRKLNLSLLDIQAAWHAFEGSENLRSRIGPLLAFDSSSRSRGFESNWASAGS
jgi:hypothetical protein